MEKDTFFREKYCRNWINIYKRGELLEIPSLSNHFIQTSYDHEYLFEFKQGGDEYQCKIEWGDEYPYLWITLDKENVGIAEGIRYLIHYLFDLSAELTHDYNLFTLFCREIRKFEEFYNNTSNYPRFLTTTPTEVGILEEEGHLIKIINLVNYFELDIELEGEDKERCISFFQLFDDYHDIYGYMDVNSIENEIIYFLNDHEDSFD